MGILTLNPRPYSKVLYYFGDVYQGTPRCLVIPNFSLVGSRVQMMGSLPASPTIMLFRDDSDEFRLSRAELKRGVVGAGGEGLLGGSGL